ncbi:hypothetical protein SCLCIDRAFT_860538 [Scleroderma citrinum Foug A]|uniref:Uncharacterized protein n=1 Tax=Scleroderma citrinum Foug A TaxID=1036808 RepID=A0A0C3E1B7_9AGAM|nr:hypothetical protein SCLCIDRAFT_860538 [Scleroderma citrinum Foug A]
MCITSKPPLKEGLHYMWTKSHSLFNMVTLLDYPGFVHRSLAHTQIKEDDVYSTDVEKWREFSRIYADNIQYISLLATVLLAANMSFLAIASIDQAPHGISYLPQRFSYWSLLSALTSIVMGSAVHSPRLFVNQSWSILRPIHEYHPRISVRMLRIQCSVFLVGITNSLCQTRCKVPTHLCCCSFWDSVVLPCRLLADHGTLQ